MVIEQQLVGVILAGGRSSRMGAEKSLIELGGVSLLERSINRFSGQVATMVLSTNGDVTRFERFERPVITDTIEGYKGPLAGLLAGMRYAIECDPKNTHIASIASDTPFFPVHLVEALVGAIGEQENLIAIPKTFGRLHPVFGVWPVSLADALEETIINGRYGVQKWLHENQFVAVKFPAAHQNGENIDPFFNINDHDDLVAARDWIEKDQ